MSGPHDIIADLLVERALFGLSAEDSARLDSLIAQTGFDPESCELESIVAQLDAALMCNSNLANESMPDAVQSRIVAKIANQNPPVAQPLSKPIPQPLARPALSRSAHSAGVLADIKDGRPAQIGSRNPSWIPTWAPLAVAAGLAIVAAAGWLRPTEPAQLDQVSIITKVDQSKDLVSLDWGDWENPEIKGVKGQVVWSESAQAGYMKFQGLPRNDSSKERYQLWIIDSRGMEQRISGAIFDSNGTSCVIPVDPGIPVVGAGAFAITIERPEGVWVSDMKRRVVIAAKKS